MSDQAQQHVVEWMTEKLVDELYFYYKQIVDDLREDEERLINIIQPSVERLAHAYAKEHNGACWFVGKEGQDMSHTQAKRIVNHMRNHVFHEELAATAQ